MSRLPLNLPQKLGRGEKNNDNNVLTTTVCMNESFQRQQSSTEQRLGPPASFGILFCTFYSLLELCGSILMMRIEKKITNSLVSAL